MFNQGYAEQELTASIFFFILASPLTNIQKIKRYRVMGAGDNGS